MNYGIIQNRRHDKKRDGAANPLLQDTRLREMAKQMGIGADELGGESAQSLWQLLDDMATNDPAAYQRFIQEQLQNGPPPSTPAATNSSNQHTHEHSDAAAGVEHAPSASDKSVEASPVLLPRYFSPLPGFVVKCAMFHTVKCQQQETKLFVNCCAHELVDAPKNPNSGKPVPDDTRAVPSTSNLEVPLIVGKVREMRDATDNLCCACDVVFHPWVMRRCEWDASFKREVLKLAVHWVQHDAHVQLVRPGGKFIKSRYKGSTNSTDTSNDIVTAKFLIEPPRTRAATESSSTATSRASSASAATNQSEVLASPAAAAMASPSALLQQIRLTRTEQDAEPTQCATDLLLTPVSKDSTTSVAASQRQRTGKLIEELRTEPSHAAAAGTAPSSSRVATSRRTSRTAGVVKKGFLLSSSAKAKSALYPTGSSEGRASSAYVNLLSRSKVVDLGDIERQRQQQQQHAERRKRLDDTLPSSSQPTRPAAAPADTHEVDCGDVEFEQLCMDADPELRAGVMSHDEDSSNDPMRALFGDGLNDLSKLLNIS